jgi:hypothetical protein
MQTTLVTNADNTGNDRFKMMKIYTTRGLFVYLKIKRHVGLLVWRKWVKSENIPNGDDIIAKDRHKMMTIPLNLLSIKNYKKKM